MPADAADPDQAARRGSPRVLIIRPSALGDVARTAPCLVTLRNALPNACIDWLVQEEFADVIRHHPMLDGVIAFPRNRFRALWRRPLMLLEARRWMKRHLRDAGYDIAIDLQGLARSGLFTRRTRAARRIGFANAREFGWLGCNVRHDIDANLHTVDRMLALLEAEGHALSHDMRLYTSPADDRWVEQWQQREHLHHHYVCIAPGARWRSKCWPLDNYIAIAHRLLDEGVEEQHIVVLASPAERHDAQRLIDALHISHADARVVMPETTVGRMMSLIKGCRLFIGNDSGPLHVAVGFDRPLVAIFGPTDPALVGPYRREECIVQPPDVTSTHRSEFRRRPQDQSLISKVIVDAAWACICKQLERQPLAPAAP